jgi:hypothetical protein
MGMAPPGFVYYKGRINGEAHWSLSCRPENPLRESIPCAAIASGTYRARWVHDHYVLQIMLDETESRFISVDADPKQPAEQNDAAFAMAPFEFAGVRFPEGKKLADYPVLVHVYGSVSLNLQVGQLAARSTCSTHVWTSSQATVNCTASPPIAIHRGGATLDVSTGPVSHASLNCEVKWRWSHCAALDPGFYFARLDKGRFLLLTHREDGKPVEVGFEPNSAERGPQSNSPIK